jgi:hypothetical protein
MLLVLAVILFAELAVRPRIDPWVGLLAAM